MAVLSDGVVSPRLSYVSPCHVRVDLLLLHPLGVHILGPDFLPSRVLLLRRRLLEKLIPLKGRLFGELLPQKRLSP